MGEGERGQKRADANTSSEGRPSTPRARSQRGAQSRPQSDPTPPPGRCDMGRSCGHVRWPALGQTSQSRLPCGFTNRKPSPATGGGVRTARPHLKLWGVGFLPRGKPREQLLQWVLGVLALHNRGEGRESLAPEQRTGGRRLRSPAHPRSRALEAPFRSCPARPPPTSLPHPLRQGRLRMYPNDKDSGPRERWVVRPTL